MIRLSMLVVVAISTVALAKPLPTGMKVIAKSDRLVVTSPAGSVLLLESSEPRGQEIYSSVTSAALSEDGKRLVVVAASCTAIEDPIEVPLARIQARFVNLAGMAFHLKKQYPDAIARFTSAVEADPDAPVLATNLLSAQSMGGKLEAADQTLATYGPKNLAWFGWRLAVDSDLKNLRGRPSVAALIATKPTKLTYRAMGGDIAVSPLGLVAVPEWIGLGMGPSAADLAIYDLKSQRELLRLPVVAVADACFDKATAEANGGMPSCTKAQLAHSTAHEHEADLVLGSLGFERRKTVWTEAHHVDSATSADKQFTIAFADDSATITHGKASAKLDHVDQNFADLGVAGNVTVLRHRVMYQCGGADSQQSTSIVLPTP